MESSKHNDELIKRKLADLSVEPRKLKFAEVHANYEKAKQTSTKKWGFYFILGTVGIAALVGAYLLLTPNTNNQLAQMPASKEGNTATAEYSSTSNPILSAGTTSEDKIVERSDDENNSYASSNSVNETSANNTEASKEANVTTVASTKNEIANETSVKESSSNKASTNSSTNNSSTSSATKKETNTPANSAAKKAKINNTSTTATDKKTGNSKTNVTKNSSGEQKITDKLTKVNAVKQTQNTDKKDVTANSNTLNTQPLANSNVNSNSGDQNLLANNTGTNSDTPSTTTKDIAKDETAQNNKGNSDQPTVTQQGSNDQNNNGSSTNTDPEIKNESSAGEVTKADQASNNSTVDTKVDSANSASHIPGVIGTGSVSPRNKHKWLIGAEASYSTIFYNAKENPNAPSQFSTGDPAFTTAYANAVGKGKHSLFNGTATFGYLYNEQIGITAGVSYFSLNTKVNLRPSTTPEYTTAVDYFVWNYVQDSSVFPPTLTLKIVDTVYKQVPTGNYNSVSAMVNGDSANTFDYHNKITYISIPLNLSYVFKIGAKFSIEPQAGVIYTMPLRSTHLVATDAYKFDHNKQKGDLRKNLYYNAALKLGYNVSNRIQLYVRQGYFFRNQSIYNADQPISLSLKSIYTSFGITFRIK